MYPTDREEPMSGDQEPRWPPSVRLIAVAFGTTPEEVGPMLVEWRKSLTYPQMAEKLKSRGAELAPSTVAELTLKAQGEDRSPIRERPWRRKEEVAP